MVDGNVGTQVARELVGDLAGKPVLSPFGLQKPPDNDEQQQNGEENPDKYSGEFPQGLIIYW